MNTFRDKRITVLGLGQWGGGVAVTRFLCRHGARVTVTDLKTAQDLADSVAALHDCNVTFHLGGHDLADFERIDAVVANPAIAPDNRYLMHARTGGAELLYETNLFFQRCHAPIIGVTGSNGKTTTATLIDLMLADLPRRVVLGGNIGKPLIEIADDLTPDDRVVLELSSFQLEALHAIECSPQIAVVTNLSPNHLDRHETMDNYEQAKRAILDYQTDHSTAILNADDPLIARWAEDARGAVTYFSMEEEFDTGAILRDEILLLRNNGKDYPIARVDELKVFGRFNIANLLAAALAAQLCGATVETIAKVARTFPGLEHRLELFATGHGLRFINDSKSTSPAATGRALSAISGNIVLIAGGYDKGVELVEFATQIARRCRSAIFVGETGERLAGLTGSAGSRSKIETVTYLPTLEDAVAFALQQAIPGDTVLLSPGCASWDMFQNFEQRGRLFKQLIGAAFAMGASGLE